MPRVTGTLELDGSTVKLDQGGNATTVSSNSPSGDITVTLPSSTSLVVGAVHGGDATKAVKFTSDGATTATTLTLDTNHTADRTITLPDATDTLVGKATTDTLTNKTLGDSNTINAQDDAFSIDDATDATKQILFNAAGTTSTATTITGSQTANRTLTLPDATDTLVGKATTDTLTNKTLGDTNTINAQDDAFSIDDATDATKQILFNAAGTTSTATTITSSQSANRVITLPDATDTLVGKATTDSLTNKTLVSPVLTTPTMTAASTLTMTEQASIRFADAAGGDYVALVAPTSVTSHTLTLPAAQGAASTVLANDGAGALTWAAALSSMLNDNNIFVGNSSNTSTALNTSLTGDILVDESTGLTLKSGAVLTLPQINDTSSDHQYVLAVNELAADRTVTLPLLAGNDEFTFNAHAQTLTNKTLTAPIISTISNTGTLTLPTSTDTLVGRATTDTLTNKTLTTPVIASISNSGTLTLPTSTDTLVGRATTDTLTNKTLSSGTISGTITLSSTPVLSGAVAFSGGNVTFDTNTLVVNSTTDAIGIGTTTTTNGKVNVTAAAAGTSLYLTDATNSTLSIGHSSGLLTYTTSGSVSQSWVLNSVEAMRVYSGGNFKVAAAISSGGNDPTSHGIQWKIITEADIDITTTGSKIFVVPGATVFLGAVGRYQQDGSDALSWQTLGNFSAADAGTTKGAIYFNGIATGHNPERLRLRVDTAGVNTPKLYIVAFYI